MSLGLTLILSVVCLAAVLVGSCVYFSAWMQKSTFSNLNALDWIRETHLPPEDWQKKYLKKCRKLGKEPPELFEKQKKRELKRLKKLRKFVKTTILVESEEVRADVLKDLDTVRQEWQARTAGETEGLY